MKIKIVFYLVLVFLLFLFPQKVTAAENGIVFFYKVLDDGDLEWNSFQIELSDELTENERALKIFSLMFEDEQLSFIPKDIKVLGVLITDGCLNLNVSGEILNYGGAYYENKMRNQIIRTALGLPGISRVSLIIENLREYLTEGSVIFEESGWMEEEDVKHLSILIHPQVYQVS